MLNRLLVAKWKGKCKIGDLVLWVCEVVLELEHEHLHFGFHILLKPKCWLLDQSSPLFLLCWQHPKHRLETLAVEFALKNGL